MPAVLGAGQWSGGAGTFSIGRTSNANQTYTPAASEYSAALPTQVITLTWTGSVPGCTIADLTTDITVNHKPKVSAGATVLGCGGNPIKLSDLG